MFEKIKEATKLNQLYFFKINGRRKKIKGIILEYDVISTQLNLYHGSQGLKLISSDERYIYIIPYSSIEFIQDEKHNTIYLAGDKQC